MHTQAEAALALARHIVDRSAALDMPIRLVTRGGVEVGVYVPSDDPAEIAREVLERWRAGHLESCGRTQDSRCAGAIKEP